MAQPVKLMMTWNIRPGQEERYLQFITQELTPLLLKAGLQATDAWYTIYGEDHPEVMMGFLAPDLEAMKHFLASEMWREVKGRLLDFVEAYRQKVIPYKGGFQL